MSHQLVMAPTKSRAWAVSATLSVCAVLTSTARAQLPAAEVHASEASQAPTAATVAPLFSPDRLGAEGSLSFTLEFAGPGGGVPTPLSRSILRLPAGVTLEVPRLRSCSASRLRARGIAGCPAGSAIGHGQALVEAHDGSQTISESVALWVFLGPAHNLQPTIEILGQAYTPFDEQVVLTGTMLPAEAPYGEALALSIPPIPTLVLEPDASIVALSLVIGARVRGNAHDANTIRLPYTCPQGGFPFAGEFTYANGSSSSSLTTTPCPP
jgi:hypothetical protein